MAARYATAADLPPEFSGVSPTVSAYWLDIAGASLGLDAWGSAASQAHALLTAHSLKLVGEGTGPAAAVVSRSAGSVSESYAIATPTDAELGSTIYGLQFLALRRARRIGPLALRMNGAAVLRG